MSLFIAPRWAFSAQAVDAASDPHLARGVHLRVWPSALMGLPVVPFKIWRVLLDDARDVQKAHHAEPIIWSDPSGRRLTAPFDVVPGVPITGWPQAPGVCCWIGIDAEVGPGGLFAEAAVSSETGGFGVVDSGYAPPFRLAASRIDRVVLSGAGTVRGVGWLDARTLDAKKPWRTLALPVPSGARYVGVADAASIADARVVRAAPQRAGFHEAPAITDPWALPRIDGASEQARVALRTRHVKEWVEQLVNDRSAPPWELTTTTTLSGGGKAKTQEATLNTLGATLQAALDPGVARWLGLMEHDGEPLGKQGGAVVAYLVRGIWAVGHELRKKLGDRRWQILKDALTDTLDLSELQPSKGSEKIAGPFVELWSVACVTLGQGSWPSPPRLLEPDVREGWRSTTPLVREIALEAQALRPGAAIALARRQSDAITGLNPRDERGQPVPLAAAGVVPGTGTFYDRTAPPEAVAYRIAQADWFGRWSGWTERGAVRIARPLPPAPSVSLTYQVAALPSPPPSDARRGTLLLTVPVPTLDALGPGSYAVDALRVEVTAEGRSERFEIPATHGDMLVRVPGPALAPAASVRVSVAAWWLADGARVVGPASEALTRTLFDPRPPATVTLPRELRYTSRPDARGVARAELAWPAIAGALGYRIYLADETSALRHLERLSDARARAALGALASEDATARAAAWISVADLLGRNVFEPLADAVQPEPRLVHAVSGALRVLMLYRVATVASSGVETTFEQTPLVPMAVPQTFPMAQPALEAKAGRCDVSASGVVVSFPLTLTIPRGSMRPATEYRLRRTRVPNTEALRMPVAQLGAIPTSHEPGPQIVPLDDRGGLFGDIELVLEPWTTYAWRVEVRTGAEPGGGPAGEWSEPSVAVTMMAAPPIPGPVLELAAVRESGGVRVRWQHAEPLVGGEVGTYGFEVHRQRPGERPERIGAADAPTLRVPREGRAAIMLDVLDVDARIPSGTRYSVTVVDPIHRTSAPRATVLGG